MKRRGGFKDQAAIEDVIKECFDGDYETVSDELDRLRGNTTYRDSFVVTPLVPRRGEKPFPVLEFDVALRQSIGSGDRVIHLTPVSIGKIVYDSQDYLFQDE